MTDAELVDGIIRVWLLISPHAPIGVGTGAKFSKKGAWKNRSYPFHVKVRAYLCEYIEDIVAKAEAAWMRDGINWTETTPQQQFDTYPRGHRI